MLCHQQTPTQTRPRRSRTWPTSSFHSRFGVLWDGYRLGAYYFVLLMLTKDLLFNVCAIAFQHGFFQTQ